MSWGPRRPEAPQKEDLEKIIKALTWEEQRDNTLLYRLDGEDAFRDLGNRLEMCNGASQDDRKVLAALAVAAKFYGGVIELTGSPEFKEKAMRLIIEHDLDIRMKIPAQRAQLEEMRKKMGASQDAVVPHQPTPDLNRHTQDAPPQAAADQTTKAAQEKSPDSPQQPQVPVPPKPTAPGNTPQQAEKPPAPIPPAPGEGPAPSAPVSPDANTIKVPEIPEEPAPSALSPGQSVTAVLKNYGEAMYENTEQRGKSFFIELENRGGSHTYWGQDLRRLVEHHKAGDVVTLTLNGRDSWTVPGEEKERVKNNWSLVATSTGIAVAHDRPEQGQRLQSFPIDTFGKLTQQIRQAWPDHMADLKLPPRFEDRLFWLGEDRHPVMAPQNTTGATAPEQAAPANITPIMASMDSQSKQMDLLLIQSAGEHLQGVVRLNGALYPALATPTADNTQLVINAVTDQGLRFAGYGQAVNFEPDGTTRAAPQLMTFHLKGREEDAPLPARLYTPEKQDDALFQRLGFEQTWKQWDDARKPEGRQEKTLHQEHSHSPGR
ncbi:LPD7 domain-containing protein [Pantoea cypripedii]|uniref:LPD7 domain-containing protein n=1 Tax=Pantoea cypripedii TaxID=55209 RepID=UPI001FC9A196|nr:LPD7 domain-containing protein [Pantoea cypripedii]